MKHENKIALVTGSSRGLGRNIALQLARSGADVIVTYRKGREEGDAVVAEITALGRKAVALQVDTSQTQTFEAFAATSDPAEQKAIAAEMQKLFAANAPAIPLFPGPAWYEYNSTRFTNFPNAENPYTVGSPFSQPYQLLFLTNIKPK